MIQPMLDLCVKKFRFLLLGQFKTTCMQYWIIISQTMGNKKSAETCQKPAEILGSGNWTRTSDIRINSPLFYRLNYARIARLSYNLFNPISSIFFIHCDFTFLVIYFNPSNKNIEEAKCY